MNYKLWIVVIILLGVCITVFYLHFFRASPTEELIKMLPKDNLPDGIYFSVAYPGMDLVVVKDEYRHASLNKEIGIVGVYGSYNNDTISIQIAKYENKKELDELFSERINTFKKSALNFTTKRVEESMIYLFDMGEVKILLMKKHNYGIGVISREKNVTNENLFQLINLVKVK